MSDFKQMLELEILMETKQLKQSQKTLAESPLEGFLYVNGKKENLIIKSSRKKSAPDGETFNSILTKTQHSPAN
ncbi:MAG: hypothetical protein HFE75_10560 [Firmicutes bacterium]|jgi:hypothetical protein|nr:hypothetical protein [Bacillota bacterium]NBI64093.1 hypothetical protein [Clostridiales bacterium]